jgi:FMN phosphatase YigB (HAD superfamily)
MNTKYIALDIGNVLCHVDEAGFLEVLSYKLNINTFKAKRFLKRFQQIHDLGYTTMEDELMDQYNIKSPFILKEIVQKWNDCITPNEYVLHKLNNLRYQHGLQVALLSNIGVEHAFMMEKKLEFGGFFPGVIKHFSCYVGARKPSMVYYQSFLLQYPQFAGCLYVDDIMDNLNASKAFGFRTFQMSLLEPGVEDKITEIESIIVSDAAVEMTESSKCG